MTLPLPSYDPDKPSSKLQLEAVRRRVYNYKKFIRDLRRHHPEREVPFDSGDTSCVNGDDLDLEDTDVTSA